MRYSDKSLSPPTVNFGRHTSANIKCSLWGRSVGFIRLCTGHLLFNTHCQPGYIIPQVAQLTATTTDIVPFKRYAHYKHGRLRRESVLVRLRPIAYEVPEEDNINIIGSHYAGIKIYPLHTCSELASRDMDFVNASKYNAMSRTLANVKFRLGSINPIRVTKEAWSDWLSGR